MGLLRLRQTWYDTAENIYTGGELPRTESRSLHRRDRQCSHYKIDLDVFCFHAVNLPIDQSTSIGITHKKNSFGTDIHWIARYAKGREQIPTDWYKITVCIN